MCLTGTAASAQHSEEEEEKKKTLRCQEDSHNQHQSTAAENYLAR